MSSKEKQSRRRYTAEFKEHAVKRVLSGHAVTAGARELGVGDSLIHNGLARHRQRAGADEVQAEQAAEIARPRAGKRKAEAKRLDEAIHRQFDAHKGRYGAPRVTEELKAEGWRVGRPRVARRMQVPGLRVRAAGKYKATPRSKHDLPVAPNRLEQDFTAGAPNQTWVSDITCGRARAGCTWRWCWTCIPVRWWAGPWGSG